MTRFAFISPIALAACGQPVPLAEDFIPEYLGVSTTVLDADLVQFNVAMTKAQSGADVLRYAECAAAQYTVDSGFSFVRHVRSNVVQEDGVWSADAVYTLSKNLPDGLVKIDAAVVADDCASSGIPTV
ncbi:MAG: hypothetical protein AAGI36_20045 [Pseudomonadota bacterium]